MIVMLAGQLEFSYSSFWISSNEKKLIADSTSHFQYLHMFSTTPHLQKKPCSPHPHPCGIKHTLTSHPKLPFSYGTALHHQPDQHTRPVKNPIWTSSSCTPNSV